MTDSNLRVQPYMLGYLDTNLSFGQRTPPPVARPPEPILLTIRDMLRVRKEIFSDDYHLPHDRKRGNGGAEA